MTLILKLTETYNNNLSFKSILNNIIPLDNTPCIVIFQSMRSWSDSLFQRATANIYIERLCYSGCEKVLKTIAIRNTT